MLVSSTMLLVDSLIKETSTVTAILIVSILLCIDARKIVYDEEDSSEMDIDENPETRPDLFEGDILLPEHEITPRLGIDLERYRKSKWKNRTVPYVISPLYEIKDYLQIVKAIRIMKFMTCIRFVPWNGKTPDYVLIYSNKATCGCYSYVGRRGSTQEINLEASDKDSYNCLEKEGVAIHELMHTIGILHEQSRNDRDDYVEIHWENIIPEYEINFNKFRRHRTVNPFKYDYKSIMHYDSFAFSKKEGKPTITALKPGVELGQRKGLSEIDCLNVNHLYGCLDDPELSQKYYKLCHKYGI